MSRKKDPMTIKRGHGLVGPKSVPPSSLTFPLPQGGDAHIWVETLYGDDVYAKNLQADTGVITDLESTTFTVQTIQANISVDTDILEARIVRASEKVETPLIEVPATGTLEIDADTEVTGDLEVGGHADIGGNVDVGNTMTASLVRAKNDVALYDEAEGTEHRHLSSMLQRFPNLSQAYRGTEEGEVFVIEPALEGRQTYDIDVMHSVGFGKAIATDGRYVFVIATGTDIHGVPGSEIRAWALDTESGDIAKTYTLTHPDFDWTSTNFWIASNGERVAFIYGHYIEIFEIENDASPQITRSFGTAPDAAANVWNDATDIYINHGPFGATLTNIPFAGSPVMTESVPGYVVASGTDLIMGGNQAPIVQALTRESLEEMGEELSLSVKRMWTDGSLIYYTAGHEEHLNAFRFPKRGGGYPFGYKVRGVFRDLNVHPGIQKIVFDAFHLYILKNDGLLERREKSNIQRRGGIFTDIPSTYSGGIVDIASDGQYLYVLLEDEDLGPAKIYLNNPPSLFKKVDPSLFGSRLLYQSLVPLEERAYPLTTGFLGVSDLAVGRITSDVEILGTVTGEIKAQNIRVDEFIRSPQVPLAMGVFGLEYINDNAEDELTFVPRGVPLNITFVEEVKESNGDWAYYFNVDDSLTEDNANFWTEVVLQGLSGDWGGGVAATQDVGVTYSYPTGNDRKTQIKIVFTRIGDGINLRPPLITGGQEFLIKVYEFPVN